MWRAANVRETPIETRDLMADRRLDAAEAMMDSNISVAPATTLPRQQLSTW
jgi:hypothetical protein